MYCSQRTCIYLLWIYQRSTVERLWLKQSKLVRRTRGLEKWWFSLCRHICFNALTRCILTIKNGSKNNWIECFSTYLEWTDVEIGVVKKNQMTPPWLLFTFGFQATSSLCSSTVREVWLSHYYHHHRKIGDGHSKNLCNKVVDFYCLVDVGCFKQKIRVHSTKNGAQLRVKSTNFCGKLW